MKAVFIVGCSRTGSKIFMNVLSHTPIDMTPELHFINPKWLHRDFIRDTQRNVGYLQNDKDVDYLMDLIYSKMLYGSFWKHVDLDRINLKQRIMSSNRSFKDIFESILLEHAYSRGKEICGAKFPVHVSFVPILLRWFPKCKIIHIFRDPRAIFASQLIKHSRKSKVKRALFYFPMLAHTIIQFKSSFRVYNCHRNLNNYYLARYEDIVTRPRKSIKSLCNFLKVPYSENMLNIPLRDSSFGYQGNGISKLSLDKWKIVISPTTSKIIRKITGKEMRLLGFL